MSNAADRVVENALDRELAHADAELERVLNSAAKDLAGQGGAYTSARLAARFVLERLNAAVDYYDAVDVKLKALRRERATGTDEIL